MFRLDRRIADPLAGLAKRLESLPKEPAVDGLPPMQGGAMGMLAYDLGHCFERIANPLHNEFEYPLALIGFYDCVITWDHLQNRCWLISQGIPEIEINARRRRSIERAGYFRELLDQRTEATSSTLVTPNSQRSPLATAHGLTAPQFDTRLSQEWIGSFDSAGLQNAVSTVRQYIAAGDVFQVNIAQRLMRLACCDSTDLYLALSEHSPAPFSGYFDGGDFQLMSASPERFLQVSADRWVETRPIKGTRPRGKDAAEDQRLYEELSRSEKDQAENTMIVDLMRNDLSRVCEIDSIEVPQLCQVERYEQVQHMVSSVRGRLRSGLGITDLLAASFPGGSITGAPKVRAMEIIAELEPTSRGPYCGSLGYVSLDGSSDWNILIRTILAKDGWWQLNVGGGIVYGSDPVQEEEETWTKARGMVEAINRILSNDQRTAMKAN